MICKLGTGHERIRRHLRMIDSDVRRLADGLDDTLIIVTADREHDDTLIIATVDCEHDDTLIIANADREHDDTTFRYISEKLRSMLVCPPLVESRAMSLFMRPGKTEEFRELLDAESGDIYTLIPRDEVVSLATVFRIR